MRKRCCSHMSKHNFSRDRCRSGAGQKIDYSLRQADGPTNFDPIWSVPVKKSNKSPALWRKIGLCAAVESVSGWTFIRDKIHLLAFFFISSSRCRQRKQPCQGYSSWHDMMTVLVFSNWTSQPKKKYTPRLHQFLRSLIYIGHGILWAEIVRT